MSLPTDHCPLILGGGNACFVLLGLNAVPVLAETDEEIAKISRVMSFAQN